jgi:hypothetical protein
VRYVGESFGDSANTILIPDYTLFDATISFDFKISAPRPQGMERSDQRDQSGEPLLCRILCDRFRLLRSWCCSHGSRNRQIRLALGDEVWRPEVWMLAVGFTGVINTWADLVIKVWQFGQLAEMTSQYADRPPVTQPTSLTAAVATA